VNKVKKLIILCEVFIVLIIMVKIASIGGLVKNSESVERYLFARPALADSSLMSSRVPQAHDVFEDTMPQERELFASLVKKERILEARESRVYSEEQKLESLKADIVTKIEQLQDIEGKLTILAQSVKTIDDKKYKDLAKVYESVPPAHAGPILEKLDMETAASIIMNMKAKKAGAVWEHMDSKKAAALTEEITRRHLSAE
jgi:flagellar motility protein MotE (MotC chaperone)